MKLVSNLFYHTQGQDRFELATEPIRPMLVKGEREDLRARIREHTIEKTVPLPFEP